MRVLLLDKEKITRINLPQEIDGVFLMSYKLENSNITKELNIEAREDNWVVKSNGSLNIIQNGNTVPEAPLRDYLHLKVSIAGRKDILDLYCLPSIERNFYKIAVTSDEITIGSGEDNAIIYNEPEIKDVHAGIYKQDDEWYIGTPEGATDCYFYINNKFIKNARSKIEIGDVIFTNGLKFIWMGTFIKISNPLNKIKLNNNLVSIFNEDNFNYDKYDTNKDTDNIELYEKEDYFFHTPTITSSIKEEEINIEKPPKVIDKNSYRDLLSSGISITLLAAAFVSLISVISNVGAESSRAGVGIAIFLCMLLAGLGLCAPKLVTMYIKRKNLQKDNTSTNNYLLYLNKKNEEINQIMQTQAQQLTNENVSINDCLAYIRNGKTSIWPREIKDDSFLNIRTGLGNVKAKIKINRPEIDFEAENEIIYQRINDLSNIPLLLQNVPVPFNLAKNRISAIINDTTYGNKFIDSVILQLITLQSAQDLKIIFLLNGNNDLSYAKYIPHVFNESKTMRYYAQTHDEMKAISNELEQIFKERQQNISTNNYNINDDSIVYRKFEPYYLIITNDFLSIKNLPIVELTLNSIENLGFSLLMIEKNMNTIPKRCNSFISLSENSGCVMERDFNSQIIFKPEFFNELDMQPIAEKLLNIPLQTRVNESTLPDTLTFLEMYNVSKIEQLNISNRWKTSDPSSSLAVPIGIRTNGEPLLLDLHENAQGPNGLVAGTTGFGKTEFLINYILSLAINYNPDEISFILIDYQNKNLINAFIKDDSFLLPHIVGGLNSLEENEIYRTIQSIKSEIKKREKLFEEAKTITGDNNVDIYKYQQYYREKIVKTPISHLFIITDEYIDMVNTSFLEELINIGTNYQKLGFHIILSTNKPEDILDEELYTNNFKICFKVQTPEESIAVLNKPDAAKIKNPGRFYLQLGFDEQLELAQASWPSAKYIPTDRLIHKQDDAICFINNIGTVTKKAQDIIKNEQQDNNNQLLSTIDYINNLATKEEYKHINVILEPLLTNLYIANLSKKYNYKPTPNVIDAVIGEYEDIENNKHDLLTINLGKENTYIVGKSNSGKEDLLSTIIYDLSINHSPKETNIYFLDNNMSFIKPYMNYPIISDIATIDDYDKIYDLFLMLSNIIEERKENISFYNNSIEEYNKNNPDKTISIITIIINNFEEFIEKYPKLIDLVSSILKEGKIYGISLLIASTYLELFENKLKESFDNKIVLQLDNKEYKKLLNINDNRLKPKNYFGRGLIEFNKNVYEFQTASIYIRNEVQKIIDTTYKSLIEKYPNNEKPYIKSIPNKPYVDRLYDYIEGLQKVPIGYDIEKKNRFYYNFKVNKGNIITGKDFSNEKNYLQALASLLKHIPNLETKIIDMSSLFNLLTVGIPCIQSNFTEAFNELITSADYITKDTLYIITGIGGIKSKFDTIANKRIDEYFLKASTIEKLHYIFIDTNNEFNSLKDKIWFDKLLNTKEGIWLGPSIEDCSVIEFNELSDNDKNISNTNNKELCFITNKDKRYIIKKVIQTERTNNNEQQNNS